MGSRSANLILGMVIVAALLGLFFNNIHYSKKKSSASPRVPTSETSAGRAHFPEGSDVFFRLSPKQKQEIIQIVVNYCKDPHFHAESCIYYVTKCGRACLADLSEDEITRLRLSYREIRKKRGLPPVVPGSPE